MSTEQPIKFTANRIESSATSIYRSKGSLSASANHYRYTGPYNATFTVADHKDVSLAELQAAGGEVGSTLQTGAVALPKARALRLDATVDFALDSDGLFAPAPRAQLIVLRSLADQYGPEALKVSVHLLGKARSPDQEVALKNAMLDLGATAIDFDSEDAGLGNVRLLTEDGKTLEEWHGFQNAAVLGGAVRAQLGAPRYAGMPLDRNGAQIQ